MDGLSVASTNSEKSGRSFSALVVFACSVETAACRAILGINGGSGYGHKQVVKNEHATKQWKELETKTKMHARNR